jgi:hypothetical protein
MKATLWLLVVHGSLGAFDTLYFHEWKARLPGRPEMHVELGLHAVRSIIYGIVFCTLPYVAWRGRPAGMLTLLLAVEAVITFADFVVEDRVRTSLGGVFPGERVMHGLMAIVYGAFMATFLPVLGEWFAGRGETLGSGMPSLLLGTLTALGIGSLLSGVRDALAASGLRLAAWPWRPTLQHRSVGSTLRARRRLPSWPPTR